MGSLKYDSRLNSGLQNRYARVATLWSESGFRGQRRSESIPIITAEVVQFLSKQTIRGVCVELGGGTGEQAKDIMNACSNCEMIVCDFSSEMLGMIRGSEIQKICGNFLKIDQLIGTSRADVVVMSGALHDLPKSGQIELVDRIYSVLKPGGIFVLAAFVPVPDFQEPFNRIVALKDECCGLQTQIGGQWLRYFAYSQEILAWLQQAHFDVRLFSLPNTAISYIGTGEMSVEQEEMFRQRVLLFSDSEIHALGLSVGQDSSLSYEFPVQGFVARKM